MPARNTIREYFAGGYYHLYNRGVGRSPIFEEDRDYTTFLHFLKKYLEPGFQQKRIHPQTKRPMYVIPDFVYEDVDLLTFCLMPNHFHLLVRNKIEQGATKLMRRVITSYSRYFNERYGLSGHLFQGIYRAAQIRSEEQLLHVSRYIHLNPKKLLHKESPLEEYSYSSYPTYLGKRQLAWLKPNDILDCFSKEKYTGSYQEFVEVYTPSQEEKGAIADLLLDQ